MNIIDLIHTWRDALLQNAALDTWTVGNYHRSATVYCGMDMRNPANVADYPIVLIYPVAKVAGWDTDSQEYQIHASCAICDETLKQLSSINSHEFESFANLEAYRKLVETAIEDAMPTGFRTSHLEIEYQMLEFFPFLEATNKFTITNEQYQGSDPFI